MRAWRLTRAVAALVVASGCRWQFESQPDGGSADVSIDAAWSTPIPLAGASTGLDEEDCTGAASKTEIIFGVFVPYDLFTIERAADGDPWGPLQPFSFNTGGAESAPRLSFDERTLYFAADGGGTNDIWSTTRIARAQPWGAPQLVAGVNSAMHEKWFSPCAGNRYVVVRSPAFSGGDLYAGTTGTGPPTPITELNTPAVETSPFLTDDCLTMYFASDRNGSFDIFRTRRASVADPWDVSTLIPEFSDPAASDQDPWISPDERMFLFASDRAGTFDVYITTR